jgi:hypothetical protein
MTAVPASLPACSGLFEPASSEAKVNSLFLGCMNNAAVAETRREYCSEQEVYGMGSNYGP